MIRASTGRFRAFLALVSILVLLTMPSNVNAAGVLSGRVVGYADGKFVQLRWAKVTVYANGAVVQSVSPGFDGGFSIALAPGLYVVTAERSGFITQSRVTAISDWHTTLMDFSLERAPDVAGDSFDFTLSIQGPVTLLVGESGWVTIQVILLSGQLQMVNLSVSGLPSNAYASLSPSTGNLPFASVCGITTSPGTQIGSHNVTVVGVSSGLTRRASFTLTIGPRLYSPDEP